MLLTKTRPFLDFSRPYFKDVTSLEIRDHDLQQVLLLGIKNFRAFSGKRFHLLNCSLETVEDFLIKLDIKPLMHLLEIITFSLNDVIVRLTKIMNRADKNWAHF